MLVLTRKADQTIVIDGGITIRIIDVKGNRIRIGIDAPQEVSVQRGELVARLEEPAAKNAPAVKGAPTALLGRQGVQLVYASCP